MQATRTCFTLAFQFLYQTHLLHKSSTTLLDSFMQDMQFIFGNIKVELLLGELFTTRLQVAPIRLNSLLQFAASLFVKENSTSCSLGRILVIRKPLTKLRKLTLKAGCIVPRPYNFHFDFWKTLLQICPLLFQGLQGSHQLFPCSRFLAESFLAKVSIQNSDIISECLITPRLRYLPLQGVDPSSLFLKDIMNSKKIGFRILQFPQCFFLLLLKLGNPGSLLKHLATILWFRTKEQIDLPLFHDRIGRTADAGIHEELMDIAEATQSVVYPVFRFSIPKNPTRNRHLVIFRLERALALRKIQGYLRHRQSFPLVGAIKDDVSHLTTPQCFGRSLPQNPTNGVNHIGFSATIRPHNPGNSFVKLKGSALSE